MKIPDLRVEELPKKFEEEVESAENNCRRYSDVEQIYQEEKEKPFRDISIRKNLSTSTHPTNEFNVLFDGHEKSKLDQERTENKRGRGAGDTS